MSLYFQGLGAPRLRAGEAWLEPPPDWPLLLLAFVAGSETGVGRGQVAAHFWPDEDEHTARHNLSQLLYRHRKKPWRSGLEAGPKRLSWTGESDLRLFRQAVAEGEWRQAVELYNGEFLSGVRSGGAAHLEAWLEAERSALHSDWREAGLKHAAQLDADRRHQEAAALLSKLLQQDLLAEDVLQAYMRSASLSGQRDQALQAFESFKGQLAGELDMEPLAATSALAEAIRCGELTPGAKGPAGAPPSPAAVSAPAESALGEATEPRQAAATVGVGAALRLQLTPFVGRDIELAEITAALSDPACRLLTLVGPGGMGKSRLARQLASEQAGLYKDGVFFVPLAPLDAPGLIVPAIAAALELSLPAEGDPQTQLFDMLHDRELLLILDNFEHILVGAGLVAELLEACPGLQVLATSREPLGFGGELLYELRGLGYPKRDDDDFALVYDAIQLFLRSARRVNSSFTLTDENRPAVARVCRLLRGMPLGLELAAAWMRLLTAGELADELGRNLDALESTRRGIPARHRSMRAVFEHSWALLSGDEQATLMRLAVFRGGFDKSAAQTVAQTTLRTLLSLVNKSLLWRSETGRFELLEVIRQYAEERLCQDAEEERSARQRHMAHFLELAEQADAELTGPQQRHWVERLSAEHDNLRAAVSWALHMAEAELGLRLANGQYWYWHIRGHYRQGREQYDGLLALPGAGAQKALYARALHCLGSLAFSQHDYAAAEAATQESLSLYRSLDDSIGAALALWQLGAMKRDQGKLDEAQKHLDEARRLQKVSGDSFNLSTTYNDLAILSVYQDDLDGAQELLEKSLALKRRHGDSQGIAYALENLAVLADSRGEDPAMLRPRYEESLALKRELGDARGVVTSLINLSSITIRLGDTETASDYLAKGLQIAFRLGDKLRLLVLASCCAHLALELGLFERVATYVGAVSALSERYDIALPPDTRGSMAQSLETAQSRLDETVYARACARGEAMGLGELVAYAQELAGEKALES